MHGIKAERVRGVVVLLALAGIVPAFVGAAVEPPHPPPAHAPAPPAAHAPAPPAARPAPAAAAPKPAAPGPKPAAPAAPAATPAPATGAEPEAAVDASSALERLRDGNKRWVAGSPQHPRCDAERRSGVARAGQVPFATVLTCADSRLPVERLFDQGVGDVFVLRVAGNVAGVNEAGTIEYGVEHLHTPLLIVMGHSACGAVKAVAGGAHVEGNIAALVAPIAPAVDRARRANPAGDEAQIVAAAVEQNVWQSVFDLLKRSGTCRTLVKEGKLTIVGAVCDIATGEVKWLGEHPWQAQLVDAFDEMGAERRAGADEGK